MPWNRLASRAWISRTSNAAIVVVVELAVMFVAATRLTPLYPLYRRRLGFGGVTLTLVYSVYVLGNLSAPVFFAQLSQPTRPTQSILLLARPSA